MYILWKKCFETCLDELWIFIWHCVLSCNLSEYNSDMLFNSVYFFFNLKCDRNSNDKFSRTTYTWQKLYAVINWNLATVSSEGFFCLSALFNITANILRTGQSFNLTVSDTCNYDYTVNFGDSSPEQSLDNPQKIISHTYNRSGSYDVEVKSKSSSSSFSLCGNATKSIVVKDAIQNMVSYGAGGLLHRMAYTGWLHTKVVLFQAGL